MRICHFMQKKKTTDEILAVRLLPVKKQGQELQQVLIDPEKVYDRMQTGAVVQDGCGIAPRISFLFALVMDRLTDKVR